MVAVGAGARVAEEDGREEVSMLVEVFVVDDASTAPIKVTLGDGDTLISEAGTVEETLLLLKIYLIV